MSENPKECGLLLFAVVVKKRMPKFIVKIIPRTVNCCLSSEAIGNPVLWEASRLSSVGRWRHRSRTRLRPSLPDQVIPPTRHAVNGDFPGKATEQKSLAGHSGSLWLGANSEKQPVARKEA